MIFICMIYKKLSYQWLLTMSRLQTETWGSPEMASSFLWRPFWILRSAGAGQEPRNIRGLVMGLGQSGKSRKIRLLVELASSSEDFSVPDLPEYSWSCKSSPCHAKVSRRGRTGRVKMYQREWCTSLLGSSLGFPGDMGVAEGRGAPPPERPSDFAYKLVMRSCWFSYCLNRNDD